MNIDKASPLDDLISSIIDEDFFTVVGREHRLYPGPADRLACLFNWDDLVGVLTNQQLRSPQLRLVRHAEVLPETTYVRASRGRRSRVRLELNTDAVSQAFADGYTAALRYADELHPALGDLAAAFERRLEQPFEFNAYASFVATPGFGAHWDDHDVFVFQLAGAKRWRVFGRTENSLRPRSAGKEPVPAEPIDDVQLTAGDVLYLPRGFWHDPVALDGEPSLHVTGSAESVTGAGLATWAVQELALRDTMCADVPRFADDAAHAEFVARLREEIVAAFDDPTLLKRYLAHCSTNLGRGRSLTLPHVGVVGR